MTVQYQSIGATLGLDPSGEAAARAAGATDSDIGLIRGLKAKAREYADARAHLESLGPAVARSGDNDLMRRYGELVADADAMQARVAWALRAVDTAVDAARRAFGSQLGALGGFPVLLAIGIPSLTAALAWTVTKIYRFADDTATRAAVARELIRKGVAPDEAARRAREAVSPSRGGMSLFAFVGIVGFGVMLLLRNR